MCFVLFSQLLLWKLLCTVTAGGCCVDVFCITVHSASGMISFLLIVWGSFCYVFPEC